MPLDVLEPPVGMASALEKTAPFGADGIGGVGGAVGAEGVGGAVGIVAVAGPATAVAVRAAVVVAVVVAPACGRDEADAAARASDAVVEGVG